MTKDVKWVEIPGTREVALELFRLLGVSALPVVRSDSGEFVGMLSLRKLFENPDEDQIAKLVDRDLPTVSPDDDIKVCAEKMVRGNLRRLAVVDNSKLVGIITVRDIVYRVLCEGMDKQVSEYMRTLTVAIWEGTPLRAALEIMSLAGLRALPVIDSEGNLVGVVDDYDIIKICDIQTDSKTSALSGRSEGDTWAWDTEARIYITKRVLKLPDKTVRDVMTRELITVSRKTTVSECARLMKDHRIEQLPVLSATGKLVGMIYDIDLLKALV